MDDMFGDALLFLGNACGAEEEEVGESTTMSVLASTSTVHQLQEGENEEERKEEQQQSTATVRNQNRYLNNF